MPKRRKLDRKTHLVDWVSQRCSPEPNTGCFLWTAELNKEGYPIAMLPFSLSAYPRKVHRPLWEATHGPLGKLELWRTCGVRHCLNLAHMEIVDPEGRELSNKRLISRKIRYWIKEKKQKAKRFEEWRLRNNGELG